MRSGEGVCVCVCPGYLRRVTVLTMATLVIRVNIGGLRGLFVFLLFFLSLTVFKSMSFTDLMKEKHMMNTAINIIYYRRNNMGKRCNKNVRMLIALSLSKKHKK